MTPDEFEETLANLAAGDPGEHPKGCFYTDAETLRRFVAEVVRLTADNARLQARLQELETGLEPGEFTTTARTVWPGEG